MTFSRGRWLRALWFVPALAVAAVLVWIFQPALVVGEPETTGRRASIGVGTGDGAESSRSVVPIEVATVTKGDLSLWSEATGHLESWRVAEISAAASGQVLSRQVKEGDWVEAGATLLQLDARDAEFELQQARIELLRERAAFAVEYGLEMSAAPLVTTLPEIEVARRDFEQKQALFGEGLVPQEEVDRSQQRLRALEVLSGDQRQEVQAATSGLAQAEQRVAQAEDAVARTRVPAPFAGRIADLVCEVGQRVSVGQTCMTLQDDRSVKVRVEVLEEDIVRLQRGTQVLVRVPSLDDLELPGEIHSINPRIDHETGAGRITVALPNRRGRLLPGLFAYVRIETRRLQDGILAPVEAVLDRDGREVTFRIVDGHARWAYVVTGARNSQQVEIISGLDAGDTIAVGGHFTLSHDTPVSIRERFDDAAGTPPAQDR